MVGRQRGAPVGQCNLRCRMCPIQFRSDGGPGHPPAFMPYEVFCGLIDQFDGVSELQLQGMGEPMLHPRFFDMVAYAAARGIAVSTNTNLTVLSERRADACIRSGLRRMQVSLDAPNPMNTSVCADALSACCATCAV
jgi:MoaA/NifB/PqqE/SkfB family radical SAM enzyme